MTELIARRYVPPQFAQAQPRLFLVGEAPNEQDAIEGRPFTGSDGQLLDNVLKALGTRRDECHITNVFKTRPPENKVEFFFESPLTAKKSGLAASSQTPLYSGVGYLMPMHQNSLDELKAEIIKTQPSIIVALGNTAMWALTGQTGVSKLRGHLVDCTLVPGFKVIMTYHPAAVLRQWEFKPLLFSDLQKASIYQPGKDIIRNVVLDPGLADLERFYHEHIAPIKGTTVPLAFDIETANDDILCIGFAVGGFSIVVPFYSGRVEQPSYWKTDDEELQALQWVKGVLEDPTITKLGHNVMYDIQWLKARWGICTAQPIHDTMVMFHSIQPEMRKGLNELVSMYTYAPPWKTWVSHGNKATSNKRDN